ncbi:aspartate-semialdehyde dehydrogenase [Bisgaardia hudsonensis]|uniref:Aspartate-semialdehyde dehydrogenase n=1 Tax=Bisgaardia hudsonensis TaxID=109472 RepID=A0A4R2N1I0_9PAST|nr:oxidoreductase [Bisgaardia hudsonensis]QLB13049.1 aspartate-semialdehyde dehydrogenase [Bisgaardia hudsonensis]TCP13386.1 aspartate-semialdehyde dehydrogenase [Bisgaardia hudsonensis]
MLNIAISAEFSLAEKLIENLELSSLEIEKITAVEIYPFSEEQGLRFKNKSVTQIEVEKVDWSAFTYVFFAGDISKATYLAKAAESGCIVIDILGLCADIADVPVIIPNMNNNQLIELRQRNIVALPNPQVTQCALSIANIIKNLSIHQLTITSLLPASYENEESVTKLAGQTARLLNGITLDDNEQRLAFDVFPKQSINLNMQLKKIFSELDNIVFHQIQVPVFYGIGQLITLKSDYLIDPDIVIADWKDNEYISYHDEKVITPVTNSEVENSEAIPKLHISNINSIENGIQFWTVADEQRFNLAFMAVKLAELI